MKIRLLQNCIAEHHFGLVQPGFEPLDFRHNPHPEMREFQIFQELYESQEYKKSDILGAVSTRFSGKSLLDGNDVRHWISDNPGYEVYVVNPYPQFAYTHKNLWQFSENTRDPNFTNKSQAVLERAGLDYRLDALGHHSNSILSCCSYWFGTPSFWEAYMQDMVLPILKLTRSELGEDLYSFLYEEQEYYGVAAHGCGSLPFLLERSVSLYLQKHREIRSLFYPADRERVYQCCIFPFERDLVTLFGDKVDRWDAEGGGGEEMETYFHFASRMCGNGWRLHFKFHPMSFEGGNPRTRMPWSGM